MLLVCETLTCKQFLGFKYMLFNQNKLFFFQIEETVFDLISNICTNSPMCHLFTEKLRKIYFQHNYLKNFGVHFSVQIYLTAVCNVYKQI